MLTKIDNINKTVQLLDRYMSFDTVLCKNMSTSVESCIYESTFSDLVY